MEFMGIRLGPALKISGHAAHLRAHHRMQCMSATQIPKVKRTRMRRKQLAKKDTVASKVPEILSPPKTDKIDGMQQEGKFYDNKENLETEILLESLEKADSNITENEVGNEATETDKPSGSSDKPSGSSDKPSGSSEKPSGSSDKPSGSSDKPSGSSDKPPGSSDNVDKLKNFDGDEVENFFSAEIKLDSSASIDKDKLMENTCLIDTEQLTNDLLMEIDLNIDEITGSNKETNNDAPCSIGKYNAVDVSTCNGLDHVVKQEGDVSTVF